jgi:hypothetical protein
MDKYGREEQYYLYLLPPDNCKCQNKVNVLENVLEQIKNNKLTGTDELNAEVFKYASNKITHYYIS